MILCYYYTELKYTIVVYVHMLTLYYTISLHIKHILNEYIINVYKISIHWREEGNE